MCVVLSSIHLTSNWQFNSQYLIKTVFKAQ